jgi:hypothetical protein
MRILLILILAGLSTWLLYDRTATKEKLQLALDKLSETQSRMQSALDSSKKETEVALEQVRQLSPERQGLLVKLQQQQIATVSKQAEVNQKEAELAKKQAEVERLSRKTWLQDQIESRGDPLARPATPNPAAIMHRTSPYYYPYSPYYPYTKNP